VTAKPSPQEQGAFVMPARAKKLVTAVLLLGSLAACSPTVSNHGYRIDPDTLARIQPGITSREEVYRLLGSPSSVGTFDTERWYYISQRSEQMSFYQSEITEQDIVMVDFDAGGVVRDVTKQDKSMAMAIEPSPDKTRTMGNELSLVQQLLGNVGRFNANSTDGLGRSTTVGRQ
jgi:outer membrane protein assembly factor BamE (lipoprotein component of BamABCDE complex)